ncbi:hypothetical protein JQ628_21360 [Bradyrhizobium lablabi]|uniref:hypothetical protein n=1 Tax=Bradyrhizobium lablabi TaxID=722472 RepID=UPI001BAD2875|nr:hypothetical protein [Bradyrhizobium lablabi]MBR1124092.1 hypothetical protein [Bradyrhizobium lablabi]
MLKKLLFGIWGLLLIPLIAPVAAKWLAEHIFSDSRGAATTVFRDAIATPAFTHLLALGQQPWFRFAVVFLTGVVVGVALEWLSRKSGERKADRLRSLGWKFRSLSESLRLRTASPGWPDNARELQPAMLSLFGSARKFDLWAPNERAFQLPDATFLCEYLRCVGKHLEDGDFDDARKEALSWRPFLDQVKRNS